MAGLSPSRVQVRRWRPRPRTTAPAEAAPRTLRGRAWAVYLGLALALGAAYFLVPGLRGSGPLFNVAGLSAAVAIVVGARMHRPQDRLPWYLLAAAQVLFVTGDVLYYTLPGILHYSVDFPSAGDVFYVCVYPLIIAGLLLLIHRRNPHRDLAALVDALIIGVGVGVVSWAYLMVPYVTDEGLPLGTKTLSITYPLMDVLVLAVTVRLAVDAGHRPPAFFLLIAGLVSLVCADTVYGVIELNGTYATGSLLDAGWLVYYFAWGLAALHPSMRTLSQPVGTGTAALGRRRLLLLGAVSLLAPAVALSRLTTTTFADEGVLIVGSAVLFLLVVLRLWLLIREHERLSRVERALRLKAAARDNLLAHVVRAQEVERRELAADLHDDVLQDLAALSMVIERIDRDGGAGTAVDRAGALVERIEERLRSLVRGMRPSELDHGTVVDALRAAADRLMSGHDAQIRVTGSLPLEPDEDRRTMLYHIGVEAISNALRHAAPGLVTVDIRLDPCGDDVRLRVVDDGAGFDAVAVTEQPRPGHIGLTSMAERAAMLGGLFTMTSRPGVGTCVEVVCPLGSR